GVNTAVTDSSGVASIAVAANKVAGSYTVTPSVANVSPTASFTLTNKVDVAASIVVDPSSSGSGQTATVAGQFTNPLVALVADQYGNPVSGVSVTFAAPGTGAGASFHGGATVTTDSNGRATSNAAVANNTAGTYTVTATAGTLAAANFTLTNSAGAAN